MTGETRRPFPAKAKFSRFYWEGVRAAHDLAARRRAREAVHAERARLHAERARLHAERARLAARLRGGPNAGPTGGPTIT